jgi:nitrite reductase/ring-hydroxylating ferredoxin subunit
MSGETDTNPVSGDLVEVAPESAFEDESPEYATVEGTPVGVIRVDGEFYAISNVCAHEGGPVCRGRIGRELLAEYVGPGQPIEETLSETPAVACPWHGWEYDLTTGEHLGDDDIVLPTFEVVVRDETVYVASE